MSYDQHRRAAEPIVARCAVLTLSDTRTAATDTSGQAIRDQLSAGGHQVVESHILPDDPAALRPMLDDLLRRDGIDAILTNGGTGVSRRDQTIAVVEQAIDLRLDGFGELFRMLSWQQIGSGAMLSRAVGGVARGKLLFAMPGSTAAVELAMAQLIVPELKHLLGQLRK